MPSPSSSGHHAHTATSLNSEKSEKGTEKKASSTNESEKLTGMNHSRTFVSTRSDGKSSQPEHPLAWTCQVE